MATLALVRLITFPHDDPTFDADLRQAASEFGPGPLQPASLEARMRPAYPQVVIRPREPLGGFDAAGPTWYAYRDGSALGLEPDPTDGLADARLHRPSVRSGLVEPEGSIA